MVSVHLSGTSILIIFIDIMLKTLASKNRIKLLFICLGNICRSPAAHAIMQHIVDEHHDGNRFEIDSAGIGGWHIGDLPDRRMRQHGSQHGYRLNHRARQFNAGRDFADFDLILVMDAENRRNLLRQARCDDERRKVMMLSDFLRHHPKADEIPDPYYGGDQDFEYVIELLEDALTELYQQLS